MRRRAAGGLTLLSLLVCSLLALGAAAQEPSAGEPPVSLERIREGLAKPDTLSSALQAPQPAVRPRFRSSVEARSRVLTFEEQLRKDLEPTPLLRQSREWASNCCGMDLSVLINGIEQALDRRKARKIRAQIARELEELKAASAAKPPSPK